MRTLLLLLIPFFGFSQIQNTTNMGRCLAANHYLKLSGSTEKEIYKPCSVCFTDDVFAIYVPELGTISFMIDPATLTNKPTANGVEENFMNAEDATTQAGEYVVDITYSNPKIVLFEEPRYGIAIEIKAPTWLGSPENSGTGKVSFSAMKIEKTKPHDTIPIPKSSYTEIVYAPFPGTGDSINNYIYHSYFHNTYNNLPKSYVVLSPMVDKAGRLLSLGILGGKGIPDTLLSSLTTFLKNSELRWKIIERPNRLYNYSYQGDNFEIYFPDYYYKLLNK